MIFPWEHLAQLLQLALGLLAIFVAPEAVARMIERSRSKFVARCEPVRHPDNETIRWRITLINRSKLFLDLSIYIFPEAPGNRVIRYRVKTSNDGGLLVRHELDEGCLHLTFDRFQRNRKVRIDLVLDRSDVIDFRSVAGRVYVQYLLRGRFGKSKPALRTLTHQRVFIIMIVYLMIGGIVSGRLLWLALFR